MVLLSDLNQPRYQHNVDNNRYRKYRDTIFWQYHTTLSAMQYGIALSEKKIHALLPFNLAKSRCLTKQQLSFLTFGPAFAWEKAYNVLQYSYVGSSLCFGTEPLCFFSLIIKSSLCNILNYHATLCHTDKWIKVKQRMHTCSCPRINTPCGLIGW